MSHEIHELDRVILGSNTPAWHGLGLVRPGQFNTAKEACQAAMPWRVILEDVFTQDGVKVPKHNFTVRDDLPRDDYRRVLGVVGDRYEPVQNWDVADIVDAFGGEAGMKVETVGTLRNGKIVWFLAEDPNELSVKGDRIKRYTLGTTTHDGTGKVVFTPTDTRVVCWNTWNAAINRADKTSFSLSHNKSGKSKLGDIRLAAHKMGEHFQRTGEFWQQIADKPVSIEGVAGFLQALWPIDKDKDSDDTIKGKRQRQLAVAKLFDGAQAGGSHVAVKNTAYGLLQAVGEYADHQMTVRRTGGATTQQARMESVLWGSAADLKQKAVDILLASIDEDLTVKSAAQAQAVDDLMAQWAA